MTSPRATENRRRRSAREVHRPAGLPFLVDYLNAGSGKAAAAHRGVSEVAVRRHLSELYQDMDVRNASQAVLVAQHRGDISYCAECPEVFTGSRRAHRASIEHAYWRGVVRGPGCWEWTRSRLPNGYGRLHVGRGVMGYAHRVAYELAFGPIPDGMVVMHRCDNRPCVRPDHLTVGTHQDNVDDCLNKGRRRRRVGIQTSG